MRKRIRNSLYAKVFFLTAAILLGVSSFTSGLLAWLTPKTYAGELSDVLRERTSDFVSELRSVTFENSGGLFEQFLQNPQVGGVELYDDNGAIVDVPAAAAQEWSGNEAVIGQASYEGYETAPLVSESYYFSFADSGRRYMLIVYGDGEQIGLLYRSFVRILPVLLACSVLLALVFAFFYAAVIMQLQNTNRRLAADIERERALERERTDFFSAVSHELKTPVTVIKGQLEGMLLGIGAYKDRDTYLARALEVTNSLEQLVQELLTVSRLEAPSMGLKSERFDAAGLIRDYINRMEDVTAEKELYIECSLPPQAFVCGNKMLLEKVFSNLIGNAIKYAPRGADVRVALRQERGRFVCSVENSKTHIPEECMPKLFEAFYRVEQSRNRRLGGSGLGLYIVKKVLDLYGSRCEVCNTQAGVRFSFSLESGENE